MWTETRLITARPRDELVRASSVHAVDQPHELCRCVPVVVLHVIAHRGSVKAGGRRDSQYGSGMRLGGRLGVRANWDEDDEDVLEV